MEIPMIFSSFHPPPSLKSCMPFCRCAGEQDGQDETILHLRCLWHHYFSSVNLKFGVPLLSKYMLFLWGDDDLGWESRKLSKEVGGHSSHISSKNLICYLTVIFCQTSGLAQDLNLENPQPIFHDQTGDARPALLALPSRTNHQVQSVFCVFHCMAVLKAGSRAKTSHGSIPASQSCKN